MYVFYEVPRGHTKSYDKNNPTGHNGLLDLEVLPEHLHTLSQLSMNSNHWWVITPSS